MNKFSKIGIGVGIAFAGGATFTLVILDGYLIFSPKILDRYGHFTAKSLLRDDEVPYKIADGIFDKLFGKILNKLHMIFDEIKEGFQYQINETNKRIDENKNEIIQLKVDKKESNDKISEIDIHNNREFKLLRSKYEQAERRRIHSDSEAVRERVLKEEAERQLQYYKDKEKEEEQLLAKKLNFQNDEDQ